MINLIIDKIIWCFLGVSIIILSPFIYFDTRKKQEPAFTMTSIEPRKPGDKNGR